MKQNLEQTARDKIDRQLIADSWVVQNKTAINLKASFDEAARECQTGVGPADYVLFEHANPIRINNPRGKKEIGAGPATKTFICNVIN